MRHVDKFCATDGDSSEIVTFRLQASIMREQLIALEGRARQLDPSVEMFDQWMSELAIFARQYLSGLDERPAVDNSNADGVRRGFA